MQLKFLTQRKSVMNLNKEWNMRIEYNTEKWCIETIAKREKEYIKTLEHNKREVQSREYLEWIYNCVLSNVAIDNVLCENEGFKKGLLLNFFADYIIGLAEKQRVIVKENRMSKFKNGEVAIKIKDEYFLVSKVYLEIPYISIRILEEEPDYAFVKM